jgi:tight adherence protein C
MRTQEIIFLVLLFVAVFLMLLLILNWFDTDPSRKRVEGYVNKNDHNPTNSEFISTLVKVVDPIGKLSLPSEGWDRSPLYIKFVNAGWRSAEAPKIYFGIKTILTLSFALIAYIYIDKSMQAENPSGLIFLIILCAAMGYYLPNLVLANILKKRQLEIVETLPDMTDLLIVCMEAGLSFDQEVTAIQPRD